MFWISLLEIEKLWQGTWDPLVQPQQFNNHLQCLLKPTKLNILAEVFVERTVSVYEQTVSKSFWEKGLDK